MHTPRGHSPKLTDRLALRATSLAAALVALVHDKGQPAQRPEEEQQDDEPAPRLGLEPPRPLVLE